MIDLINKNYEYEYSKNTKISHRKKFAQFFTPSEIADLMSKWVIGDSNIKQILDPAFGLGIFARKILEKKSNMIIKGFDIDSLIFEESKNIFANQVNINIILQDYMHNDWENKYDGIICNPPYLKFQDYDNLNIIKEIESKLDCKLSGFTNLYTLFLIKSVYQLAKNGRLAYVVPSEFLNSDYGKLIKQYLIKNKVLRHIVIINSDLNLFEDANTTACVLLLSKDEHVEKVRFSNVSNLSDLTNIKRAVEIYPKFENNRLYKTSDLDPNVKWRKYYQKPNSIKYKNLVPFTNYAKVTRGIATGSNQYFLFNRSKIEINNIEKESLVKCISKSADIKTAFFRDSDFEDLVEKDKLVYLFNAITDSKSVNNYIQKGIDEGIDKLYLTSSRKPWYSIENRKPAPILASVFNRGNIKFVKNETDSLNLSTFHSVYPNENNLFSTNNSDFLFAYLITDIAQEIFNDNRREYGNGLMKFEPNDINKSLILDIQLIPENDKKTVLDLYSNYRECVINNIDGNPSLDKINSIFVQNFIK
jgi:adenine-specific DNA-methyltransferase